MYNELVEAQLKHFNPIPSVIVERFKFHSRVRKAGESIVTYVAKLRSLSEYCEFGTTLEDMLWDHLVCGVNDHNIQKSLLVQKDLMYAKQEELAVSSEAAVRSMRDLGIKPPVSGGQDPLEVHKTGTQKITCYCCGGQDHTSSKYRVDKDIVCHQCHKRGHMKRVCRSKGKHGGSVKTKRKTQSVGLCARGRGGRGTRARGRFLQHSQQSGHSIPTYHNQSQVGRLPGGHGSNTPRGLHLPDV